MLRLVQLTQRSGFGSAGAKYQSNMQAASAANTKGGGGLGAATTFSLNWLCFSFLNKFKLRYLLNVPLESGCFSSGGERNFTAFWRPAAAA
jgi:hypothetical protein